MIEKYKDKKWLYEQYWDKKLTMQTIADKCDVNRKTIGNWMDRFGIKKRNASENKKLVYENKDIWNKGLTIETDSRIKSRKGSKAPGWKGGRFKTKDGYIQIYKPDHPRANRSYVYEHMLIIEKEIGRYLWKFEIVHHIDGKRDNNLLENLFLCKNKSEHNNIDYTLKRVAHELVRTGLIKFDRKNKKYYLNED